MVVWFVKEQKLRIIAYILLYRIVVLGSIEESDVNGLLALSLVCGYTFEVDKPKSAHAVLYQREHFIM